MSAHTDRLLRLMVENGVTNTAVLERLNADSQQRSWLEFGGLGFVKSRDDDTAGGVVQILLVSKAQCFSKTLQLVNPGKCLFSYSLVHYCITTVSLAFLSF